VKFETLTYAASSTDFSVGGASALAILGRLEPSQGSTSSEGGLYPAHMPECLAAFLLRVVAYFQGCLSALPVLERCVLESLFEERMTLADSSIDETSEPLQLVRMNRALSRRMRWLMKRGRVERPGKVRIATAQDKARCNLTPGQFIEYSIRVHGWSRPRSYGFGLGRQALRKIAICFAGLQGDTLSLRQAMMCNALISPD